SLHYFNVEVSEPGLGVPEFVELGYVDGNLISRYDSETERTVPRAEWMEANLDPQYWDTQSQISHNSHQVARIDLETV
ncbi:HA1W protein, partial [Turnix velox]|nr:HA1W protein [Turnix velox]